MSTPLNKKATTEEIRKRFDEEVERFSNLETGQQTAVDAALMMELIVKAAAACNPAARAVLDIGCGAGNNTLKLLQHKNDIDCDLVDLSMKMLERAFQRVSAATSGAVRMFQSDIREADLPHGHYDIIFAAAVLHHLRDDDDWRGTFRRMYELTAPGGTVWITDLVFHENKEVHALLWERYGKYLESTGGEEYRDRIFDFIEKQDSPRPVTFQLDLLREAGFAEVDVLHKNVCFAAFGARKSK